jgi:hypothetical protein
MFREEIQQELCCHRDEKDKKTQKNGRERIRQLMMSKANIDSSK